MPGIISAIFGIMVVSAVFVFVGLFIYCGIEYLKYKILRYRVSRLMERHPLRGPEIIATPARRIRRVHTRRRPSDLVLELDLTRERTN
jgi:hypothetical protein